MSEKGVASGARWQTASVYAITPRTPKIKSFLFNLADPITFMAGQHVDVRLTAPNGYNAVRSYSIASAPESEQRIELAIEMRGPLGGHFIWDASCGGPLLLIGGGSGLVPLLSILRHRKSIHNGVPAILVLSARTWDDVPFRDELLEMDGAKDGFQLVLTLTQDTRRRLTDYQRRIDSDMMREVLGRLPSAPSLAYACGTNKFVDTAVDAAIDAGVPKKADIRTERYGG